MTKKVYLTKEGFNKLKEKYADYVNNKRGEASEKIKIAREYGDLSENAEYDAAKEEQAMIESEIRIMEEQIANAIIIEEEALDENIVGVGSFVKVYDTEFDEECEYQIVGVTEANIDLNRISNESPIAKALIGHKNGDRVTVHTGQSDFDVEIRGVRR